MWFSLFDDISRAIHYLENVDVDSLLPDCVRVGPGSRGLLETLATLEFLQYHANPTAENRQAVRDEAEKLFGAYLNFPFAIDSAVMVQRQVIRIGRLVGEDQVIIRSSRFVAEGDRKEAVKRQVWPFLKQHGFSKFTTRVAYRTVGEVVQIIEVSPLDWADRKIAPEPIGAFEMRLGLFWPLLSVKRENEKAGHSQCLIAKSSPGF